jgi:hypothetical protein
VLPLLHSSATFRKFWQKNHYLAPRTWSCASERVCDAHPPLRQWHSLLRSESNNHRGLSLHTNICKQEHFTDHGEIFTLRFLFRHSWHALLDFVRRRFKLNSVRKGLSPGAGAMSCSCRGWSIKPGQMLISNDDTVSGRTTS